MSVIWLYYITWVILQFLISLATVICKIIHYYAVAVIVSETVCVNMNQSCRLEQAHFLTYLLSSALFPDFLYLEETHFQLSDWPNTPDFAVLHTANKSFLIG